MTPQELLTAAYRRQDVLIDYMPHWADKRQHVIIRDWLMEESDSSWDILPDDDEWIEAQPCIQMARLILGTVDGSEL